MHVVWPQGCRRREKVHAHRAGGRASCHVSVAAVDQKALDGAAVAAGQELLAQARHTMHLQPALTTMTGPCRGVCVCSAATLEWQQVQQGIAAAGHVAPNSTCSCGFDKYLERARLLEAARAPSRPCRCSDSACARCKCVGATRRGLLPRLYWYAALPVPASSMLASLPACLHSCLPCLAKLDGTLHLQLQGLEACVQGL